MKKGAVFGIIFAVVFVILLKVFQNSIPRISEPITNTIVLVGFVVLAMIIGISQLLKKRDEQ